MTIITGGHGLGLQDGSYALLNRNDTTSRGTLGHGVESFVNVANGNLLLQEVDAFLPSQGEDFRLIRTYDSRGKLGSGSDGWILSTAVTLSSHQDKLANSQTSYTVTYGDGSTSEFALSDARNGIYTSTDGAGAYRNVNTFLRGDVADPTRAEEIRAGYDAYIRLATQGIAQFDQYQGTTFRGLTLDDASFDKQFQEGGTWIGRSFLSSAANPKSAFGGGQASTLLVLNSRTGRSVEALSLLPHEREVLFPPGSKWKVLRVEKFPDVQRIEPTDQTWGRIVYLDEIPSGI
jgi:hypothetical protein